MNWADYGLKGLALLGAIVLAYWVGKKGIVPVWNAVKGAGTAAKVDWVLLETRLTALEVAAGLKPPVPTIAQVAAGTAPVPPGTLIPLAKAVS